MATGKSRGVSRDLLWTNDSAKNIAWMKTGGCCQITQPVLLCFFSFLSTVLAACGLFKNTFSVGTFFFVMGYLTIRQCSFLKWHFFLFNVKFIWCNPSDIKMYNVLLVFGVF